MPQDLLFMNNTKVAILDITIQVYTSYTCGSSPNKLCKTSIDFTNNKVNWLVYQSAATSLTSFFQTRSTSVHLSGKEAIFSMTTLNSGPAILSMIDENTGNDADSSDRVC